MSDKTKAQLAAELAAANIELAALRAADGHVATALSQYKAKVKKIALEAKKEHHWCDEIDEILEELDIDPSLPRFRFTAMIPVTIEATVRSQPSSEATDTELADWIRRCLNKTAIEEALDIGQQYSSDDDGTLLNIDWDTYEGLDSTNSWTLAVGDITVQDVVRVSG